MPTALCSAVTERHLRVGLVTGRVQAPSVFDPIRNRILTDVTDVTKLELRRGDSKWSA